MAGFSGKDFYSGDRFAYAYEPPAEIEGEGIEIMPIEEETLLLEQIKAGNREKARKALGILLDRLLGKGNLASFVAQMVELLAVTFRMAAQIADSQKAGVLKIKLAKELHQVDSPKKAVAWAEQMMLQYIDLICKEKSISASQKIIDKANKYIAENYNRDISLNELAEYVHLSPSYFCRLYKQVTKCNLVDFINSVRISHAKNLLVGSSHDIDYIAFAVGFNTHNYFTTVFRRFVGMTPSEYRLVKNRGSADAPSKVQ